MHSQYDQLTPLAISKMLEGDADDQAIVVQVFDINVTKNGRLLCTISDGNFFTKAYLNDDSVIKPGKDQLSVICIKSHAALKNSVGVTKLNLVTKYHQKLGTPIDWLSGKQNITEPQFQKQYKLQKKVKVQPKVTKSEPVIKKEMPSAAKTTPAKAQEYQSIDDLHIGLTRWTILCRINRKIFKQSQKKGTKILQIELVDKSKKKIIGTFFKQAAIQFNDYLKEGSIYQISKGRLIEGNYNNSKNEKISPYTLIFDEKSQFNEVSDVNIIARAQDTAITLGDVYHRRTLNQEFDVVAYVVEVKQQKTFERGDKQTKIKQVVVADPDNQITMSVNLWRWSQPFDSDMVGKVVIFNRFVLRENKESLSLNNGRAACVILQHAHPMKKYEGKRFDASSFKSVTQTWQRTEENPSDFCKNTQELEQRVKRMAGDETIKSLLFVWINRFAFGRKWNYEACPKCKKAGQKYSKCNHCGFAIEETQLKFTMGVQMSDFCGSIWITAYDDLAKKIFQDMGNTAANQLQQLSKDELSQKLQNYVYQPYRLKILTSKDEEGRVKHRSVKMYDLHEQKVARDNLQKIKELMSSRY